MPFSWPAMTATCCGLCSGPPPGFGPPVSEMSQSRAVWSVPADRRKRPSGEGHTSRTQAVWPARVRMQYPLATSHKRRVLSPLALTRRFFPEAEEGMKRTALTLCSWPARVRVFLYSSAGSHSLMVESELHDARRMAPLGPPKSTSSTALVWPLSVRSSSPSSQSQILMV
ncbi:hypothetical protein VTK26DRAFT_106 [Humicola hyalothermophila]